MVGDSRVVAFVLARGGSKRLPGKNARPFRGLPLLAHTIRCAHQTPEIDRILLSTDDAQLADIGREQGASVPFLRPPHLATDEATSMDVLWHAIDEVHRAGPPLVDTDIVLILQPTSPLRTPAHVSAALALIENEVESVLSVTAARPAAWLEVVDSAGHLRPLFAPGTVPAVGKDERLMLPNGAIYAARLGFLRQHGGFLGPRTAAYVMPSWASVDIDTAEDWELAERCAGIVDDPA